jgi:methylmalonyl-CoA/ethylmalonyl-CoA epimerase
VNRRVAHIGIAVGNLDQAIGVFAALLGRSPEDTVTVSDQNVRIAVFDTDGCRVELMEGASPESAVSRFVESRGPGIHHFCLTVPDIDREIERLKMAGFRMIDHTPRIGADGGRIAFVHPDSTGGVLVELHQEK